MPRDARANTGKSILETMGISIAVGTVLGASTLPFYDQPGKHLMNVAYGASAGAVVGIGVLVYGFVTGPSQDRFDDFASDWQPGPVSRKQSTASLASLHNLGANLKLGGVEKSSTSLASSGSARPAQFWMPVVSLNW